MHKEQFDEISYHTSLIYRVKTFYNFWIRFYKNCQCAFKDVPTMRCHTQCTCAGRFIELRFQKDISW